VTIDDRVDIDLGSVGLTAEPHRLLVEPGDLSGELASLAPIARARAGDEPRGDIAGGPSRLRLDPDLTPAGTIAARASHASSPPPSSPSTSAR